MGLSLAHESAAIEYCFRANFKTRSYGKWRFSFTQQSLKNII
jgi:hypothetical protein